MKKPLFKTIDGNEAVANIAYRVNEVIAIYPITPASVMGELADAWASEGVKNIWGTVPSVIEMQSEGGAAGVVHGSLQTGSLTTTFTASQGLLLMLPNMFKIAGELTPAVFHIAARSLAGQALSIFGDHSDVMVARGTGFGMLASGSVQEAMDIATIAHAGTLKARIPFLHFFDGFRTSHEVNKVEMVDEDMLRAMIDEELVEAHHTRALSPDHPVLRGTAQNPDVYFQARESVNSYYEQCPAIIQETMDQFAELTGRAYHLFDYYGAPDADRVILLMGSGCGAVQESVDFLNSQGEKVGLVKVRLYRPFDMKSFLKSFPESTKKIAVLDRTKEPGSAGEPLFQDCVTAFQEGMGNEWSNPLPVIVGGRYGLSSKEFTPAMVKAVFDNLSEIQPKKHFTIGIQDDVMHTHIPFDSNFSIESKAMTRAIFYGLGSDGTVGANKTSIKIIGEHSPNYAQGYFVYDSKKSGAMTISHLRFGPDPIQSTYLIQEASFVACHQPVFLERYNVLQQMEAGGTFLLNLPYAPEEVWEKLPRPIQTEILEKQLKVYVIDAQKVAHQAGMGRRINTVMQVCFFAISNVLPQDEAIEAIKTSIQTTYSKKGRHIAEMNIRAVDETLAHLFPVPLPEAVSSKTEFLPPVSEEAPDFVKNVLGEIIGGRGDQLPVSMLPSDGTYPTGTSQWEKRNIGLKIPVWDPTICIDCGKCSIVCPHAVIRLKAYEPKYLDNAPASFKSKDARDKDWKGLKYTIQVAPEDCTGCGICVDFCPVKNKKITRLKAINMEDQPPLRVQEKENWEYFLDIPSLDRRELKINSIRQQQAQEPLFEFSGACEGCGETPYIKLATQLFGDHMLVANATGCSSIYGGNLPTTPWTKNAEGRGPAWSNSLFEDNAEFGLGFRVSLDKQKEFAEELVRQLKSEIGEGLAEEILSADQNDEAGIYEQRERVADLKQKLEKSTSSVAQKLLTLADVLVKKSVWIIGGDGWAYDIGFGGLDHVLASGRNVNILVLDTEVYSNTGGQTSKSTPLGAVAKFSASGKPTQKKDLGMIAMNYGNVYVGSVAMGAKDEHTLRTFLEAEAYPGTSIIVAYSHCIAHGIEMSTALQNHKALVQSGQWLLYRYNPALKEEGKNPLQLDFSAARTSVDQFRNLESRFKMLAKSHPQIAKKFLHTAQKQIKEHYAFYEHMASQSFSSGKTDVES
ncbi:MAG: pyruvate:ferredoxin (flavodoxin) oxidoreductase [SAR324 cluster bacterium]|nr:pyruvate:ferredoxin (flavodoxin) oxidoreductase [SAR324 cluster bacterium]